MNRSLRTAFILVALAALLPACLPAALEDATPDAAVIGVPANARVPAAADLLHERLRESSTGHDLVGRAALEFLEVRRGGVGGRVTNSAASVARAAGADVAVAVGASILEREILSPERAPTERVTLRLEVTLIRASDAAELARFHGRRVVEERFLDEPELPPLAQDPILRRLTEREIARLAPVVAEALRELSLSGSSGG